MTLSEKYKHLEIFKPYFSLWLNLTYDEKGEPWVIKILGDYLTEENSIYFRENILNYHKDLIEINHNLLDFQKHYLNLFNSYGR